MKVQVKLGKNDVKHMLSDYIADFDTPAEIKAKLDDYVIGQDEAKRRIAMMAYQRNLRRLSQRSRDGVELDKPNLMMVGPTGVGKTELVRALSKIIDVPVHIADATELTAKGYIGSTGKEMVGGLMKEAERYLYHHKNVAEQSQRKLEELATNGVIFIDEIDKIKVEPRETGRDINGASVQEDLLKIIEGCDLDFDKQEVEKQQLPLKHINTSNITFILAGAFPGVEDLVRMRSQPKQIGFNQVGQDLSGSDSKTLDKLRSMIRPQDLVDYGMMYEFIGRCSILTHLHHMSEDLLVRVLKEPKNSIIDQFTHLFHLMGHEIEFSDEFLKAVARHALGLGTGARSLRSSMERALFELQFSAPDEFGNKYHIDERFWDENSND